MTNEEWERRRRYLKRQCQALMNDEKIQKVFIKIRDLWSTRILKNFDPVLSEKIDILTKLIDD